MTIHSSHPFAAPEPERDPIRRLRGRVGGAVSLWTSGAGERRAGLTVSSFLVVAGEPPRLVGLVDPDSDLHEELVATGRGVVHLLEWAHRDLAEAFAGLAPAPGGPFRRADFVDTEWGPRLATASTWASVSVESTTLLGWSVLVTCVVGEVVLGDGDPLVHRRGRYQRPTATDG